MKHKPRRKQGSTKLLRLWTREQAANALPYFRSVVGSLRDQWLELQQARRRVSRLDARPGRADRARLLERQSAADETDRAQSRFEETLEELMALDVYCLDPVAGQALIPFRQGEELAWFVFDLFDANGLDAWRFHHDPLDKRRPLTEAPPALPKAEIG
jgi:hypothetical protein